MNERELGIGLWRGMVVLVVAVVASVTVWFAWPSSEPPMPEPAPARTGEEAEPDAEASPPRTELASLRLDMPGWRRDDDIIAPHLLEHLRLDPGNSRWFNPTLVNQVFVVVVLLILAGPSLADHSFQGLDIGR